MSLRDLGRLPSFVVMLTALGACTGAGEPDRTLTAGFLNGNDAHDRPVAMAEFSRPAGAAEPSAGFTGTLSFVGKDGQGGIEVLIDPYGLVESVGDTIRYLPDFEFALVQRGSDLVPIRRGVVRTQHPYWEYILQPGRVWQEPADHGWSRASLPFSLQERSANCTHNGVMTWLFDDAGNVSRVAYQISSETCGYLQFNLWGVIPARFRPGEDREGAAAVARLDAHRASRLPVRPVSRLGTDYPGVDAGNMGAVDGVKAEDMTVYGFVVDGVHYRSDCQTRHGTYPYCDSLPLPSYSTAKSIFAGVGLMRMQKRHPGAAAITVSSLVPECPPDRWGDVTLENALDMATGNFEEKGWDVDEDSAAHTLFLDDDKHASKIEFACGHFTRRAEPGSTWVYHTSDTYVLGTAMQNFVARQHGAPVDLYEHVIARPAWRDLNLSPLLDDTKRTYDDVAQPFTGYGLTYESDDIVRIALWLSRDGAKIDGEPYLDEHMLGAALQRAGNDAGLPTTVPTLRYDNGFWGFNAASRLGCDHDVWVPFMSGYGGIAVAMFPNDTLYYYFSDGYVHRWASAAVESDKIRNLCD